MCYEKYEGERAKKAEIFTGKGNIKPDHFVKFLAERCEICPHSLVTPLSAYLIETMSMLDGESSLTLPAPITETPALFFESLSVVRSARHQAKSEETKE